MNSVIWLAIEGGSGGRVGEDTGGNYLLGMTWVEVGFAAVGLLIFGLLGWRGCFRRSVFELSRVRRTPLRVTDIVVGFAIMLIGGQVAALIGMRYLGVTGDQAGTISAEQIAGQALLGQAVGQLPVVLYLLWCVGLISGGIRELGIQADRLLKDIKLGVMGLVVAIPVVMGLTAVVVAVGRAYGSVPPALGHPVLEAVSETASLGVVVLLFFSAMVLAPIFEEFIFRGLVQTSLLGTLGSHRRWAALWIASTGFMLVHSSVPWHVLPGLFVLGGVLGWIYEKSGSLLPSVIVHVGFNAINLLIALFIYQN